MGIRPVIKSKVIVPQLPDTALITDRIKNLGIEQNRVVSIVAPAGYGKTTAILAALKHKSHVHWYRLEKEDARLPIFYTHLTVSLFAAVKKQPVESLHYLQSISDFARGYELVNATICQDVWSVYGEKGQRRYYLVLDDFHHVIENEQIIETMRYFIANMPQNLHIIIASRKETGILDGRFGLRSDVRRINDIDLSFQEAEIAQYVQQQRDLTLLPSIVARICENTEGWISGVVLLCNLIERSGSDNIDAYFHDLPEKDDIIKYFLSEVLVGFPPEILRTAAIMATMEEFSIPDVEKAFGIENADRIIAYCEQMNLFIHKTVSNTTTYRFHSLFRNALLSLRDQLFTVKEIEELNLRASCYYIGIDDIVKAVRHMLLAHRVTEVVQLLCANGKKLLFSGEGEHLKMLMEDLPPELIESNPYLSFFYGFSILSSEFERSCKYLNNAIAGFESQHNTDMQVEAMAVLFTAFAQRNDVVMIRKLVDDLKRMDEHIKNGDVRGTLLACRLGRAAFDEDFEEGLQLAAEIGQYKLNDMWRYGVNNFLCMIYYRLGDLAKARQIIEENMKMPLVQGNDQYKMLNLVFCHTIALYWNDTNWSTCIRNMLLILGEKYHSGYAMGFGKKDAAVARYISHDIDGAVEFISASGRYFKTYQNDAQVHRSTMFRNLWLLEKNPNLVNLEEVTEAYHYLIKTPVGQGFAETAQSIAGIILRETGWYDKAEELLHRSFEASKRKKARQNMAGTAMHLAKLYYDLKDHLRGDMYLKTFISISFENEYVTYYDLFFPTLVEMAARCVVQDLHAEYAVSLIRRYYGEQAAMYIAEHPEELCLAEEVSNFTNRFGELQTGKTTIRVQLLGDFKVFIGDRLIEESMWKTRKTQRILKYLLLKRKYTPKELLAELFWPNTGKKAAMASLNVALYELRRVLSHYGAAPEDKFPLVVERMDGFEITASHHLRVDTDRLLQLYNRYKLYESRGGDILSTLKEVAALYQGDLLPQDRYEDWTLLEREHFKSKYLECAHKLAILYMDDGFYDHAEELLVKILSVDPYDEGACRMLLKLYDMTERNRMAQNVSHSLMKRLEELKR